MSDSEKAGLPDPYRRTEGAWVGPVPAPVMEQAFWVQVDLPPETEIRATAPEGVRLIDRTRPGARRRFTRLYFRSDRGIAGGEVRLVPPAGGEIVVPLRVLTYREDIEEKAGKVEGIDPAARKRGRSYYTDEMIALARDNLARHPDLVSDLKAETPFDRMADPELFAFLPSWNLPRQCYGNWPCPFCGEKIYEKSAFYPWQHGPKGGFRCACPLCGRVFPTNDITRDDFAGGDYPDDGWGYDYGDGGRATHAGWVALHNHTIWQYAGQTVKRMAERSLLLGDEAAAHRVALLCARLAYIYPGMDMNWQQVRAEYLRDGRLLLDGNWERTGVLVPFCQAYDAVFDSVGRDWSLAEFLQGKDPAVRSPDDVRALIETCMIQVFGWDWIARRLSGGNMGARERDLAYIAVCADMGEVSDRWVEELFTRAYNSGGNRGGFDDETFVNTSTREGPGWVSGFGYAYGYLKSRSDVAEILSRVTSPRWKARCNLYDAARYPKLRAEFDTWTRMLVAGHHAPEYGDSGSPRGSQCAGGVAAHLRAEYARAYGRWPTDLLARALHRAGRSAPALFEPDVWPRVEAHVARAGPAPPPGSRVIDGVGFVFLESRAGAQRVEERAGVALRYGYARGHHHHDNLNVEMWAHDTAVTPELGYPCWAHPMGDTTHTAHHNTGMIDRGGQYRGPVARGTLEMFAGAPEASFADVSAAPAGFPSRVYRRAVCLADAPDGNVYLFDLFRMAGGKTRTFCFHGPGHRAFEASLRFGPGAAGPFAVTGIGRSFGNNLVEPQAAASDGDAWADWAHDQKGLHLRLDLLGQPGRRYVTARYARPDSPPIRFLFSEDEGEDGASEFVALWQPYAGRPFIERVERLSVEGRGEFGEYPPVVVRVTLAGGQTDTFIYSGDPSIPVRCGGLEFQGHFAYWSERNGAPRCAHLVNGSRLVKGGVGIPDVPPPYRARVTGVDFQGNGLSLDAGLPSGALLSGRLIFIRGGRHRTAYAVDSVLPQGAGVRLDLNALLFQSRLEGIGEDRSCLVAELPPPIEASRGFPPGYYDDALLTGEDLRAHYRVKRVEGEKIFLDRPARPEDFPDLDGDGRRMVYIYDVGPGDEATIYNSAFTRFTEGGPS